MKAPSISRRKLIKGSLLMLALASVGRFSTEVLAQTKKKLIDMSGKSADAANKSALNIAKGLNYVENADAAEKAGKIKRVEKAGVAPAKQYCDNCQFYKATDAASGECTLIQGVLVHAKGYCNSWIKSATWKG